MKNRQKNEKLEKRNEKMGKILQNLTKNWKIDQKNERRQKN